MWQLWIPPNQLNCSLYLDLEHPIFKLATWETLILYTNPNLTSILLPPKAPVTLNTFQTSTQHLHAALLPLPSSGTHYFPLCCYTKHSTFSMYSKGLICCSLTPALWPDLGNQSWKSICFVFTGCRCTFPPVFWPQLPQPHEGRVSYNKHMHCDSELLQQRGCRDKMGCRIHTPAWGVERSPLHLMLQHQLLCFWVLAQPHTHCPQFPSAMLLAWCWHLYIQAAIAALWSAYSDLSSAALPHTAGISPKKARGQAAMQGVLYTQAHLFFIKTEPFILYAICARGASLSPTSFEEQHPQTYRLV